MPTYKRWSSIRGSFQLKLFFIFTLLTFLSTSLLTTLYIVTNMRHKVDVASEQLQFRARLLGDSIRLPLYAENRGMLKQLAVQAARVPLVCAVVITSPDGRLLVDVRSPDTACRAEVISQAVEVRSNSLLDFVESSTDDASDATAALIGTVRMERGTADLSRDVRQMILVSVSSAVLFWLVVTGLCYLALRRVTRSFNALIQGIGVMHGGDYSNRIEIESDDEPGRAARAINTLASTLQHRGEENLRLHEERMDFERQMLNAQKLESLGVMAGGIAHDFNNLLQSVLGNMELATMKIELNQAPQKYIANATDSAKRAAHLTDLMLTYVGKGFIAKMELNLNELIRTNVDMLMTAASTAVSIELSLSTELPHILTDEAHIQQVVMNLIINAAESIEEQPGLIRLTTGVQDCDQACLAASMLDMKPEPGRYVFLEVSDNGCGMNEETLKRLFDPFFTTKFAGRGLGMSAVLGIMKSHCGALFVESEPGTGTTFRVLFPLSESTLPATVPKATTPVPHIGGRSESSLSGLALVVDDEKSVLKVCAKMVTLCGFKVITASDGIDAVTKFREHADEIVVVLMDLTMPNMDGIAAMNEIYGIRPDVKVILSSGFNEDELSERITSQPPSGFIRKPYTMNVLETEMQRILQVD